MVGLETDKYIGMPSMYKFGCDPDIVIGKASCRWIPYVYLTCLRMLKLTWGINLNYNDQSRYGFHERYIHCELLRVTTIWG